MNWFDAQIHLIHLGLIRFDLKEWPLLKEFLAFRIVTS